MSRVFIPAGYQSVLSLYETQEAIGLIKKIFQGNFPTPCISSAYPRRFSWTEPRA